MIEIEGRVLAGLDEFMLRVGHLVVLCRVANDVGGSWVRIHREAAARLSTPIEIAQLRNQEVALYLAQKELCRRAGATNGEPRRKQYQYPDLEIYEAVGGELRIQRADARTDVLVSWQDGNFSDSRMRSRVGAITGTAKRGSKTGLSHVCDWAQFLELIDSAGQLSPIGRLLVGLTGSELIPFEVWNPYVLGIERIIPAYQYFRRDIDLFVRFAPRLLTAQAPLNKSTCRTLFVEALRSCDSDSETSKALRPRARFELLQQMRDLERSAKKARTEIEETSTAWHRTASRVETLTDLGLLEKGKRGDGEKYKYVYYPTKRLAYAVETLGRVETGEQWIEDYLVATVIGDVAMNCGYNESLPRELRLADLQRIVGALKLPTTQIPIDCLVLGLAYLNGKVSLYQSLGELRRMIEAIPARFPDVGRLARGREGIRAEYLSLDFRKMAKA